MFTKKSMLNVCFPAVRLTGNQESKYHLDVIPSLVNVAVLNKMHVKSVSCLVHTVELTKLQEVMN